MFNVSSAPHNEKIFLDIKELPKNQERWIRKAFYFIGKDLVRDAQKLIMKKPKHGRLYRLRDKSGIRRLHRASAPGEAPANFSKSLFKSLDFNVIGADRMQFGAQETFENRQGNKAGVKYGRALELGYSPRKLEPRPYLLPTIKSNYRNIRKHFETQLKRGLTQGYK